ncbi:12401_t:CDS:2, partial [Acaulospora colombiana]
ISNVGVSWPVGASTCQTNPRLPGSDYEQKAQGCNKGGNLHESYKRVLRVEFLLRLIS